MEEVLFLFCFVLFLFMAMAAYFIPSLNFYSCYGKLFPGDIWPGLCGSTSKQSCVKGILGMQGRQRDFLYIKRPASFKERNIL